MEGRVSAAVVKEVAAKIGCGYSLTKDLLVLAGWDARLVVDACHAETGIDSVKDHIINARFEKLESKE